MLVVDVDVLGSHEEVVFEVLLIDKGVRREQTHPALHRCLLLLLGSDYHQWVGLLLAERSMNCLRVPCYVTEVDRIGKEVQKYEISPLVDGCSPSVHQHPVTPHVVSAIHQVHLHLLHL